MHLLTGMKHPHDFRDKTAALSVTVDEAAVRHLGAETRTQRLPWKAHAKRYPARLRSLRHARGSRLYPPHAHAEIAELLERGLPEVVEPPSHLPGLLKAEIGRVIAVLAAHVPAARDFIGRSITRLTRDTRSPPRVPTAAITTDARRLKGITDGSHT